MPRRSPPVRLDAALPPQLQQHAIIHGFRSLMDPGARAPACRAVETKGWYAAVRAAEHRNYAREKRLKCGHAAADDADVDFHCAAAMLARSVIGKGRSRQASR